MEWLFCDINIVLYDTYFGARKDKDSIIFLDSIYDLSLVVRKPVFGVSDQVRHKPGCTATEDG